MFSTLNIKLNTVLLTLTSVSNVILGVRNDCCVWFGIHYPDMVCRLLLSISRMAGKVKICQETILCNR